MRSEAIRYVTERSLSRNEPVYSANRFAKLVADIDVADLTTPHLERYRSACQQQGLSANTIESSVSDLLTLHRHFTGCIISPGRRLRVPRPEPHPVSIDTVQATWEGAEPWIRQWIVISYWTALRLGDSLTLQLRLTSDVPDVLRLTANKTGHSQRWPVPEWLRSHLLPVPLRFTANTDCARRSVRIGIMAATRIAHVPCWHPKFLRQCSLTEWSRANGMAGAIIHGSGLSGVMKHYIDPLSVLESAAPRVRLPECFGATTGDTEASLVANFRRLDTAAKGLIAGTAERLAAG